MGLIYANVFVSNPILPELISIKARAHVDTGALHLCIP